MERIFREDVLGAGLGKVRLPRGIIAGQRPGVLVGFGLAYQPYASARLPQAGVVRLAGGLEPSQQRLILGTAHPQRHLADEEEVRVGGSSAERGRLGITLLPLLNENRYSRTSLPQTKRPSKDPNQRPCIPRRQDRGARTSHFL